MHNIGYSLKYILLEIGLGNIMCLLLNYSVLKCRSDHISALYAKYRVMPLSIGNLKKGLGTSYFNKKVLF